MIKLLIGKRIVGIVLTKAPQQGLAEDTKDKFYKNLISLISKVSQNELVMIVGDLKELVRKDARGYNKIHRGFGYGVRNLEGERILEMGSALDMTVCNTFFKKHDSRLMTITSGSSKTQIDYIMVRNKDRKRVRDVKVFPVEENVQQHQLLVCDIMICAVNEVVKPFVPKRKVWKSKEDAN